MLQGKVSLVTGGASGLGKATVERLLKCGGKVIFCDIQKERGAVVAKSFGNDVIFSPGDVCSEEDVTKTLELAKSKFGRLDIVVNCAGISYAKHVYNFNRKTCHHLDGFKDTIMTNTVGTFNVVRLAAGVMGQNEPNADGERGVIVNTSSFAAFEGQAGQAAYAASKAAVAGMTLPLARDLASVGIRVVAIAPGLFDTPLLSYLPEKVRSFFARNIPFPSRLGRPEEFAHMVTCIVENPMLNGEVIRLDGAMRLSL